MAEEVSLIFEAQTQDLVTANTRLDKLNKTGKQTATVQKQVGQSFSKNNAALQNTAFQLQDIVVQLEGGVAPSRALAQQIPQLLGGFGALGAVSGLVAGLGLSLAGPLVNGLFESTDGAEALNDALEELEDTIRIAKDGTVLLSEEFEQLAAQSRDVAEVQLKARLITATNAATAAFGVLKTEVDDFNTTLGANSRSIATGRAAISELAKEYGLAAPEIRELAELTRTAISTESLEDAQALRDRVTELALSSGTTTDAFTEFAQEVNTAAASLEEADRISDLLSSSLNDLDGALKESGETAVENSEKIAKALEKQEEAQQRALLSAGQAAQREQDSAASALSQLERQLASREQLIQLNADKQLAIADQASELLLISAQERADLEVAIEKNKQAEIDKLQQQQVESQASSQQQLLSGVTDQLGGLSSLISSESRELFEIGKAASIANATIKGVETTLAAIAWGTQTGGPILGAALGAASAATTGALIAQISSAQPPARALGGLVTEGQAYRVGEFGPETFVPSSSGRIIPNEGMAANDSKLEVVNNIKVIGGNSDAQVTTQTTRQDDRKIIQDIVVDLMANQSSPARQALQRTSNVVPRGTR